MYISVVEDNPKVLEMVEMALMLQGHTVEAHGDSPSFFSALQKTERSPAYDLVIVDLYLGEESGTDVVDALSGTKVRAIPTILMSAATESTFIPIKKRYPNLPILHKPFNVRSLVSLVDQTAGR